MRKALSTNRICLFILQLASAGLLFGRAWQHLVWEGPFRIFFGSESLFGPVVNYFGSEWNDYATSPFSYNFIMGITHVVGVVLLLGGVVACFAHKNLPRRLLFILPVMSGVLFVENLLYAKDNSWQFAYFIEHVLQIVTPLALFFMVEVNRSNKYQPRFAGLLLVATACTYIGHGLYAGGWTVVVPGSFIDMFIYTLGVTETQARQLLKCAGALDIAISVGIFIPGFVRKLSLIYAASWGFITALDRLVWSYAAGDELNWLKQWLFEFTVRTPHALIPLMLLIWYFPEVEQFLVTSLTRTQNLLSKIRTKHFLLGVRSINGQRP